MDPNTVILVALSMAIGSVLPLIIVEFLKYFRPKAKPSADNVKFTIKTGEDTIEISTVIKEDELTNLINQLRKAQAN